MSSFEAVSNFRDVSIGAKMKKNLLFRCAKLSTLNEKDIRVLGKNGEVIIQGGLNVHITGNVNLTCANAFNHHVKGNYSLQIDGTKTEVVTGLVSETYKANQTTKITGKLDLDASSEVDVDAGIINLN